MNYIDIKNRYKTTNKNTKSKNNNKTALNLINHGLKPWFLDVPWSIDLGHPSINMCKETTKR